MSKVIAKFTWLFSLKLPVRVNWWLIIILGLGILVVIIGLKTIPENRLILNYWLALLGVNLAIGLFIGANSTIMAVMRIHLITLELALLSYYLLVTISV